LKQLPLQQAALPVQKFPSAVQLPVQ